MKNIGEKNKNQIIWRINPSLRNSYNYNKHSNENLGPGLYNVKENLFIGPKYSIGHKVKFKNTMKSYTGSYYNLQNSSSIIFSFPKRKRDYKMSRRANKRFDSSPGPNAYSIYRVYQSNCYISMTKSPQRRELKYSDSKYIPGEGNFE